MRQVVSAAANIFLPVEALRAERRSFTSVLVESSMQQMRVAARHAVYVVGALFDCKDYKGYNQRIQNSDHSVDVEVHAAWTNV